MKRLACLVALAVTLVGQELKTPLAHFGFEPGEDRRLLLWDDLLAYFRELDQASEHLRIERLGQSTEGREFPVLLISGRPEAEWPALIARQKKLASGTCTAAERDNILRDHPCFVYVQGTLHSTEVGASLLFPRFVHGLLTGTDPERRALRQDVFLILAPSANPDGLDLVTHWYRRTLDTPWEGTSPPELYQRYAGHDNNRDWVQQNLVETRLVSEALYRRYLPAVVLDIHQMGSKGARMFVPPFSDPINPNLPAVLSRAMDLAGTHMALALSERGLTGVGQDATFDNYWTGGARNVPVRHNMIGLLTETAGARLATPLQLTLNDLDAAAQGFRSQGAQGQFPDPWLGGRWGLKEILDYQEVSTEALLRYCARYRREVSKNFHDLAASERVTGAREAPFGWVIPRDGQGDAAARRRLVEILLAGGLEVHELTEEARLDGRLHPKGSILVRADQAFRRYAKDILEPQIYPEVKLAPKAGVLRPYDASAWSLPALLGVDVAPIGTPLSPNLALNNLSGAPNEPTQSPPSEKGQFTTWPVRGCASFALAIRAVNEGIVVRSTPDRAGLFAVSREDESRLIALGFGLGITLTASDSPASWSTWSKPRVAILRIYPASMDGGWTRLVLETQGLEPTMIGSAEVRAGRLHDRFEALIIPAESARSLEDGPAPHELPPDYRGGLGVEGARELRRFVEAGGRLIAWADSTPYVARQLSLGVEIVMPDSEAVVCPGSLLRTKLRSSLGEGSEGPIVFASSGRTMTIDPSPRAHVQVTPRLDYASEELLWAGYLEGESSLLGRTVLVRGEIGKGVVDLFAFRPLYRAWSMGTYYLVLRSLCGF